MNRVTPLLLAILMVAACTGEPGGGGVNIDIEEPTTTSTAPSTTTTTTTIPTTTTTLPPVQISGRVADGGGQPVPRATVSMGDDETTTGPDGWFLLETSSPTTLTVAKPGWDGVHVEYTAANAFYEVSIAPLHVRGLRVGPETAGDDAAFGRMLQLARDSAVNTLVFDTKQEGGKVLYDTAIQDAHAIGAVEPFYDPAARVAEAHAEDLYTITRIVSFEDGHRASAFSDEKLAGPWLDPASDGARGYLLALAEEACEIGFDEIQFDYVRYPTGQAAQVSGHLEMAQAERVGVISSFLAEARELLHSMGCAVSADIFGIVTSAPDDQGLGQRPEELSASVDILSPMIYPSHYSPGWLGFEDPNDHPYDVTTDAITDGLPRMAEGSHMRPYLQAFWWTNAQIRRSIQAAEDLGVGWILWNARSNFDLEALPTDAEVAP